MNNLNSILVDGNLVRDPELTETPKGTKVCNFSVASNRYYKQENETHKEVSFFDVEAWSKQAELCAEYLNKGRGVRVVGRLKQDRWVGTDGKNHSKLKIVAENVEFKPDFKGNRKDEKQYTDEPEKQEEPVEAVAEQKIPF